MSTLSQAAATQAGESAAKAAIRIATLAQASLASQKSKALAAARAAVNAAQRTKTDHSMSAAVHAAAATGALADMVPASDHSPDADAVRQESRTAAQAVTTALIQASQSLYSALQQLRHDLPVAVAHDAPAAADMEQHAAHVSAQVDTALARVSDAAHAFGGSVGSIPEDVGRAIDGALTAVRGVINDGRSLVAEILRSGVTGAEHVAASIRADIDRAEAALRDIAEAGGTGLAVGGVATLAVVVGLLYAFASHH